MPLPPTSPVPIPTRSSRPRTTWWLEGRGVGGGSSGVCSPFGAERRWNTDEDPGSRVRPTRGVAFLWRGRGEPCPPARRPDVRCGVPQPPVRPRGAAGPPPPPPPALSARLLPLPGLGAFRRSGANPAARPRPHRHALRAPGPARPFGVAPPAGNGAAGRGVGGRGGGAGPLRPEGLRP